MNKEFENVIHQFNAKTKPNDRYTSFDYCYNYFTTKDLNKDLEKSCLVLGFYLASWGMYRGSSFLLQKSARHLLPVVEYISTLDKSLWLIDVDSYNSETNKIIISIHNEIRNLLIENNNASLTLVTKVLLGVFGFVPAFDSYFCKSFREIYTDQCGFRRLNNNSLNCIKLFYNDNKAIIDELSSKTFTLDFETGKQTNINYSKAKIIDMFGFTVELNKKTKA
ncbi:MAG: hypothetical protein R2753_01315 [Chitinophagales bacterium]